MKKYFLTVLLFLFLTPSGFGSPNFNFSKINFWNDDTRAVKSILNAQVKYANKTNLDKFISTYDKDYLNADGFNLDTYTKMVRELWDGYDNIKYGIKIKDIKFEGDKAIVNLTETSNATIPVTRHMSGILKSEANSVYYLKKIDGKWKVTSDKVIDEVTSMLYGEAANLDIKLTAPNEVEPNYEYCATLEFVPPKDTFAIASIARDKVEYPQKQTKEVFRKMPEDNILERLFVSNKDSTNEYIVASIGLTKAAVQDMSIKLSLTGFGYQIIRVNVTPKKEEEDVKKQ